MRTLLPDPPPPPFERLLAERERWGADRRDEVWEGVLHISPPASHEHEQIVVELVLVLAPAAKAAGLQLTGAVAIGDQDDYRVPDLAVHRPGASAQWHPTAALAVEVLSLNDETWQKLDFYAAHAVDELVIVDGGARTINWRALNQGAYAPVKRSSVLDLSADQLVRRIDWPA
ncbi:MAG: Uma2 family endonuclease [Solirubrobacteraceae bacterium]